MHKTQWEKPRNSIKKTMQMIMQKKKKRKKEKKKNRKKAREGHHQASWLPLGTKGGFDSLAPHKKMCSKKVWATDFFAVLLLCIHY